MRTWAIDEVITSSYRLGAHHLELLISFVKRKPDDPHVGATALVRVKKFLKLQMRSLSMMWMHIEEITKRNWDDYV